MAKDGFYWKESKKSPEDSKVTKLLQRYGWELDFGNDSWLIFKRRRQQGEICVIRGSKKWSLDMPDDIMGTKGPKGEGLESLQSALEDGTLPSKKPAAGCDHYDSLDEKVSGAASTAVNNAGNGHGTMDDFRLASSPKCPSCGSKDYGLMPSDFETAKCNDCGKNWNHGIVDGINNPYEKESSRTASPIYRGPERRVDVERRQKMDREIMYDVTLEDLREQLRFAKDPAETAEIEAEISRLQEMRTHQARQTLHDDSGALTGLRNRPDYGESDSYTSEINEQNSKSSSIIVIQGSHKTASGYDKAVLYVTGAEYEGMELKKFTFSPDKSRAASFSEFAAADAARQIRGRFNAAAKVAKPGDLLTTHNIKTQKQPPSALTVNNTKTQKGEAKGFLTGVMHLAPSASSGAGNVCPCASPECIKMCLNTAGMWANSEAVQNSRRMKTELYFNDRPKFLANMRKSIEALIRKADRDGLTPAIRINGTSDLPNLARQMAKEYPQVQFYDYTKIPQPWRRTLPNYDITFSRSENNEQHAINALEHGINVAVVFNTGKNEPLPKEWKGYPVIDGDIHDLRFLDKNEGIKGPLIVGLRGKGKARGKDKGGENSFVVDARPLVQIQPAPPQEPAATPKKPVESEIPAAPAAAKASSSNESVHVSHFVGGCFDDAHLNF